MYRDLIQLEDGFIPIYSVLKCKKFLGIPYGCRRIKVVRLGGVLWLGYTRGQLYQIPNTGELKDLCSKIRKKVI